MTIYDKSFFAGRSETVALSASVVVPVVKNMISPTSVLDIGCGQGEWLEAFGLDDSFGVDISAPEGEKFKGWDLRHPLELGRTFDLVLCLEVGEHLPAEAAEQLVESCVRHSNTVLFSAAVPGQAGKGHINCQPHEYWHAYFSLYEFEPLDSIRPLIQDSRVSPWYRDNVYLYVHGG